MMKMQNKVLAGTVLLMSTVLLGGCASSATSTTTSHKAASVKVAKKDHKMASKKAESESNSEVKLESAKGSSYVALPSSTISNDKSVSQSTKVNSTKVNRVASSSSSFNSSKRQPAVSNNDTQVLNGFFAASGVKQKDGDYYFVTNEGNGNYQVEIRNTGSNQDQNVANLSGLYNYNATNKQVQKVNPVTGQTN